MDDNDTYRLDIDYIDGTDDQIMCVGDLEREGLVIEAITQQGEDIILSLVAIKKITITAA